MEVFEYGNKASQNILIQMVDDHDLALLENEYKSICDNTDMDFLLRAYKVENWNTDLSPWKAAAVFGTEDFGEGAEKSLQEVLEGCRDNSKNYYIGGYSLAGLFALWAGCQTSLFKGVAAASPSIWFPGFIDYMKEHTIKSSIVYLSLGDREAKTRNPVMAKVAEKIEEAYHLLQSQDVGCILEWNKGNHFKDPDLRTARAFAWVMKQ